MHMTDLFDLFIPGPVETAEEWRRRRRREACALYRSKNLEARRKQTREYMARKRLEDPEWVKANNDRYLAAHPDRWKPRKRAYYEANKEKWAPHAERYKRENPEKYRAAIETWRKRNPEKIKAYGRKSAARPEKKVKNAARQMVRHARKKQAVPSWANLDVIATFYELAALLTLETGEKWEVDHIVPLISDRVCGLPCEANLRLLTASENRRKGNRYWPNM